MMWIRVTVIILAMSSGLMATSSDPVVAQDCGSGCARCMWLGREGVSYTPLGEVDMRCRFGDCQPCYNGPEIASEFSKSEASILREISTADTEALIGVVARYKDRILLHGPRNLLAIRGVGCQSKRVTAVSFLSRGRVRDLVGLGVQSLDGFLAQASGPEKPILPKNATAIAR